MLYSICKKKELNLKFKTKGYTILELLVSLGIFTVVIGALFSMLISQNSFFSRMAGKLDVCFMARKAANMLVKELRVSGASVYVDIWDRPIDQGGVGQDHINGRSVTFQVPVDYDDDGDFFDDLLGVIEWGADGQFEAVLEYCWDDVNNRVLRRVWDNNIPSNLVSETVIAENISAFNIQGFTYNSLTKTYESNPIEYVKDIIEITITAEKATLAGRTLDTPLTFTISQRVFCRN